MGFMVILRIKTHFCESTLLLFAPFYKEQFQILGFVLDKLNCSLVFSTFNPTFSHWKIKRASLLIPFAFYSKGKIYNSINIAATTLAETFEGNIKIQENMIIYMGKGRQMRKWIWPHELPLLAARTFEQATSKDLKVISKVHQYSF